MPRSDHGDTGTKIAATLREAILAGIYTPGERIRQDEIAESLGASRFPVREALRILDAEGLITFVANKGARVAWLSPAECQEMYLIRERLEPLLLRMNVPLLSDDDVDALAALADEMERTDDVDRFLQLDREFHLSPLEHQKTRVLGSSTLSLWNRTQHYRRAATRLLAAGGDRSVHHDHHLIVHALRRRDEEEADRALASHIRRSRLELARHPEIFEH
ncbi:MAG: GntR family transcriptional regulator [Microbacterium sp.]